MTDHLSELRAVMLDSKYARAYINLCLSRQAMGRVKRRKDHPDYVYYEAHHIFPMSIFPEYSNLKENPWNKVLLTPKEHFISHQIISKCMLRYRHQLSMKTAIELMKKLFGCATSREYELKKIEINRAGVSEETRRLQSISASNRNRPKTRKWSQETKERAIRRRKETKSKLNEAELNVKKKKRSEKCKASWKQKHESMTPHLLMNEMNEVYEVRSIQEFSKKMNLIPTRVSWVIRKKVKKHRGWTLFCP